MTAPTVYKPSAIHITIDNRSFTAIFPQNKGGLFRAVDSAIYGYISCFIESSSIGWDCYCQRGPEEPLELLATHESGDHYCKIVKEISDPENPLELLTSEEKNAKYNSWVSQIARTTLGIHLHNLRFDWIRAAVLHSKTN